MRLAAQTLRPMCGTCGQGSRSDSHAPLF